MPDQALNAGSWTTAKARRFENEERIIEFGEGKQADSYAYVYTSLFEAWGETFAESRQTC